MKSFLVRTGVVVLICAAVFYFGSLIYYGQKDIERYDVVPSLVTMGSKTSLDWIPVQWMHSEFSDRFAMFLPVWLDTISKPFWMQFDLGTPYTDLYPLSHYIPHLKKKEIRLQRLSFHQQEPVYYTGITLNIGNVLPYKATAIPIYDKLQADSLVETGERFETKIGNLGFDIIRNRILVLDYKNSRVALTDVLPADLSVQYFSSAQVSRFPVFLPVSIDKKEKLMQFDNGSSAFTMIAGRADWNDWRDPRRKTDTFTGSSWGKKEFFYRAQPAVSISVAGIDVSGQPLWTISRLQEQERTLLRSIKKFTDRQFGKTFEGLLGNEYFRNQVLVLDAKHNRAGIVR